MDRLAAMETFVCIVETGSFSAAARRLNTGQPAASKTIAHLEKRLAVSLLLRSTRGLMGGISDGKNGERQGAGVC
ncbi:hypothetical protein PS655_01174 [Pseudomonas fluorescens]|uniref:HTH lysR-type domain-containing protein n=1 Tax=Pseudomonas fluorescens TaxID=294 RepID=A0A5E6R2R5_PSEFL|nr:hypothetical protein PS655_01174 [Pseudomonas fluorescens]